MMDNAKKDRKRVRLSLDVSPELNDLLEELASDTHSSKSDVLRKAILLMEVAVDAKEQGQKLYISDRAPEGSSREIVGI